MPSGQQRLSEPGHRHVERARHALLRQLGIQVGERLAQAFGAAATLSLENAAGGGCIINLTSQAARSGGSLGAGLYSSSKAYISTLTRALAKEFKRTQRKLYFLGKWVLILGLLWAIFW